MPSRLLITSFVLLAAAAQAEDVLARFPADAPAELNAAAGLPGDVVVSAPETGVLRLAHTGIGPHLVHLFDVPLAPQDRTLLFYRLRVRGVGEAVPLHLALLAHTEGGGRFLQQANRVVVASGDWQTIETPFFIKRARETPARLTLAVRFLGAHTIEVDEAALVRDDTALPARVLTRQVRGQLGRALAGLGASTGLLVALLALVAFRGRGARVAAAMAALLFLASAAAAGYGVFEALRGAPRVVWLPYAVSGAAGLLAAVGAGALLRLHRG